MCVVGLEALVQVLSAHWVSELRVLSLLQERATNGKEERE